MNDRSRRAVRLRQLASAIAIVGGLLLSPSAAQAQNIPVRFYISPSDDGTGGPTTYLRATFSEEPPIEFTPLVFAVWADPGTAAEGQGVFSIQDLLISRVDPLVAGGLVSVVLVDFLCTEPTCQAGPRPDPETDRLIAVGDDTSPTPTLTSPFRVGFLTVLGAAEGTVSVVGGTALDANGVGGPLEIEALPNQGTLIKFVPEPAAGLQVLAGAVLLVGLAGRRRKTRDEG